MSNRNKYQSQIYKMGSNIIKGYWIRRKIYVSEKYTEYGIYGYDLDWDLCKLYSITWKTYT